MISDFKFLSYKVHSLKLDVPLTAANVARSVDPLDIWNMKIGVREPVFFTKNKVYLGGVDCGISLLDRSLPEEERPDKPILSLDIGISGLFATEGRFEQAIEDQLVKVQIPALLFPYVRATVTSLLANAGFGSVILPLINMNEVGRTALKDKEIQIIDE